MGSLPGVLCSITGLPTVLFPQQPCSGRSGGLTVYTESPATYEVERRHFEGNTAGYGQGGRFKYH